ncbi:hypothetical protein D4R42_01655 [bacterium]|nr:MAG: hypothetical protein D4R42_01655 [bacterium]
MNIVERLIDFFWSLDYITKDQKNLLESEFKFGSGNLILKEFEKGSEEKEKEIERLRAGIKELETEYKPFQKIMDAIEDLIEMKMDEEG